MSQSGDGLWYGTLAGVSVHDTVTPPPLPSLAALPLTRHPLTYDGRLGELYQLFLRNLLLTVASGGIYYFWGKVRLRQYLWSRVALDGHRFEFRGRGGEMFGGFLMILAGLTLWGILTTWVELSAEGNALLLTGAVTLVTWLLILYLAFVAQFSAQRYRLTRTLWRGIGSGMRGSSLIYGLKGLALTALLPITLMQARPFASLRLLEHRLNRISLGDRPLVMTGCRAGKIYGRYFLGCLGTVVLSLVAATVLGFTMRDQFEMSGGQFRNPVLVSIVIVVFYLCVIALSAWLMSGFWARYWNRAGDCIAWGQVRIRISSTGGMFFQHRVVNFIAVLVTLGLAYPWALHRVTRYVSRSIELYGDLDLTRLGQTTLTGAAIGEGMLNAFDPGFI